MIDRKHSFWPLGQELGLSVQETINSASPDESGHYEPYELSFVDFRRLRGQNRRWFRAGVPGLLSNPFLLGSLLCP